MSRPPHLKRALEEGPGGPRVGAFFDLDGTLIAGFSAVAFLRDRVRTGQVGVAETLDTALSMARFQLGQMGFSGLIGATARWLGGVPEADLEALAERIFTQDLAAAIYPEARALVQTHRRRGHTLALVSSATPYQVEPVARALGIPHVLCTRLEVRDGHLTGRHVRPTCWGEGKTAAARGLAEAHGIDLGASWFYTDSADDLPLLDAVGRPCPTNPDRRLTAIARRRDWPVVRFTSRGIPGPGDVLRTALAIGSVVPGLLAGAVPGVLNWSRRTAVNVTAAAWGELGTALAGIELLVRGEEHLWSHRPAVFIFNHQSAVDMLLLCKLLRRDIVGVAKREARRNLLFGPILAFADTVFIDRFDRQRAIAALAPAVDTLRAGTSIVIAPEGTRSLTPRPGPFKKGAFHIAMAARAPLVPIVFRNALDALPKHGLVIRPTTVEVVVHPPIPTDDWEAEELDDRIEAVRQLFIETLEES